MKRSELTKMVKASIRASLKEALERNSLEPDEMVDMNNAEPPPDQNMADLETLLMGVCDKFKKAHKAGIDPDLLSKAIKHIEDADLLLDGVTMMEEGMNFNRESLINQIQMTAKKIISLVDFTSLQDSSLSVMASNLQAIANKLK